MLLLLENPASGAAHFLEDLVVAVLAFFRATDGSHQVVNLSMKFASTLFWRYPLESVSILRRLGEWERANLREIRRVYTVEAALPADLVAASRRAYRARPHCAHAPVSAS